MTRTVEDSADIVIVGTGAGGATAARVLSEAGLSVILIEEGPSLAPAERSRGLLDAMTESMRDLATISTRSSAPMPLLLGRCVGGSTAVNSGIIWRLPDDTRREWIERFGLGELLEERALDRIFAQLESELDIAEVPRETRGGNADVLELAAERLGLPGRAIRRNAKLCVGRARCLQGCPEGARQSMDISYVPRALAHGARLYPLARATELCIERGRAVGVRGQTLRADGKAAGRFELRARRAVIVAGGAIFTPILLWNSGIRRAVGENFQAHPGAAVVGRFDRAVGMGFGATQAYEVPFRERGFKVESLAMPPELLAARLPGAGNDWQEQLSQLDRFAQFAAIQRVGARGRVRPGFFGMVDVRYELQPEDVARLKHSVALMVRMMFAAGAVEVYPGVASVPERMTAPEQAEALLDRKVQRKDFHLIASHHFGTAAAGSDPQRSVVTPDLQSHEVAGLYVMDASVLPTNLGVNPQHSIMGLVFHAAERLANREMPARTAA
ncbi:MAG TPA: GMC family oxidoreductase [Polyangiales bacterium]|nr:GMC family oxidoreductase [Polyangiales bacterium]